jgi:hypothetical protein
MRRRTVDTTIKSIKFQNSHIVYENFVKCTIKDYEYNLTYNPTLLSGSQGVLTPYSSSINGDVFYINTGSNENYGILKDFYTGSEFSPYATTVGLYNDAQELLGIAKMSAPMPLAANTDMTFLIKFDTTWVDRPYFVPSPTPSPSPICIIEGTAELLTGIPVSPSVTPSVTTTPSVTPSISVSPSIPATPSVTPSVSPAAPSPSVTPSVTPSVIPPSVTPTPSPSRQITSQYDFYEAYQYDCTTFNLLNTTAIMCAPKGSTLNNTKFYKGLDGYAYSKFAGISNPGYPVPIIYTFGLNTVQEACAFGIFEE